MGQQSRVKGIAISYVATAVRTLIKLCLTPLYLKILGLDEYGFYEYVFSIASYVVVLDFGITAVINAFAIKYKEKGDQKGVENVMFYTFAFSTVSAIIIAIFGAVIIIGAPQIFGDAVAGRITLTRELLVLMISELIMLMFQHFFEGVILAAEKYVTSRAVDLVQIVGRCTITILLLYSKVGVMSIALGDFFGVGCCLLFEIIYCKKVLNLKIKFHYKDNKLLRGIAKLATALCLQSLISFLNSSIDKYILGRKLDTVSVTIYTLALTFSMFYDEIATVIQRLYLPQVVKLVARKADGEELTSFVIGPGRYQLIFCGGILGEFILFGREFLSMWSGEETTQAWTIALLLMAPSLLPLIQNVCLSILTAMNKRMFRSYVLGAMALANLLLTVILVDQFGLMGAPIGTCISLVLGNNIAMNLYYKKKIGINVFRLFRSILKGIFPCAVVTTVVCIPLNFISYVGILPFATKCLAFCLVYAALLWFFGLNTLEKERISAVVHARIGKKKHKEEPAE